MSKSQQLIYSARAQQQKVQTMQTKLKQEFHEREFANWQNRGETLHLRNQLASKLGEEREKAQSQLLNRKKKLAALLEEQGEQFRKQVIENQQTTEKLKAKMTQKVKELKRQKEKNRKSEAESRLSRHFQMNADELRKVDQDFKILKTAYERNMQMVEKQQLMEKEYEDEILFAQLNKRQTKKKQEIEKKKQKEHREKLRERNAVLAIQKQMKERKADDEKILTVRERQMLNSEWEKQSELEKLKEKQDFERRRSVMKSIYDENEKQREDKENQNLDNKKRDKELIDRAVEKERQILEIEQHIKERNRSQAQLVLRSLKDRGGQVAAFEKQLEEIVKKERLKKQKEQDEAWERKEKEKFKFMNDVFKSREEILKRHQEEKNETKNVKKQEKIQVDRFFSEHQSNEIKRVEDEWRKERKSKNDILLQISNQEEKRRQLIQILASEEKERKNARQSYQKKIEQRRLQGQKTLQVFKNANHLY